MLALAAVFVVCLEKGPAARQAPPPSGPQPPTTATAGATPVEIVVIDRDGKPVDSLDSASFAVRVDGKPRQVLWVRHVSRGPGASDEAVRRFPARTDALQFAAEPARNILIVIDEYSIQRGGERTVQQAAGALVDRLGLDDRVAILRIPVLRDAQLALTTERPALRDSIRQVEGRAVASNALGAAIPAPSPVAAVDPTRTVTDPEQVALALERQSIEATAGSRADEEAAARLGFLPNFQAAIAAIRTAPGRKTIAVLSAGLPETSTSRIDEVARTALEAGATIYSIGLPGGRDELAGPLDVGALERLARATGGSFTMLGRNADKSLERVVPELAGCYVLGLERGQDRSDASGRSLRVEMPRLPHTVRAPAWLVVRPDVADLVPPSPVPAPGQNDAESPGAAGRPAALPASPGAPAKPVTLSAPAPSPRDIELQRLVSRAADYIAGYQREYSLLVADETYVQAMRASRRELRSDLLLVRPEHDTGWVSFRDVYEVDGRAVRDRDDRLKRLFLDPSEEAQDQLKAIKTESARYNIGPVDRNVNVPLFALKFLEYENIPHFRFKSGGTKDVGGVACSRIDYLESERPTLVRSNLSQDIVARGWFLIDPASGAVTGSQMAFSFSDGGSIEFTVKYTRDPKLGLWVPSEMSEFYARNLPASIGASPTFDGRATYSKFRRFQVKAETEIKIVK